MTRKKAESTSSAEGRKAPSVEDRQGMRGHDSQGNVRPADGRWDLHKPADESKYVRRTEGTAS